MFVFEAPIDLMSYCTLHRSVKSNAVALCCLYDGPLDTYLRENPHLRRIDLCLDGEYRLSRAVSADKDAVVILLVLIQQPRADEVPDDLGRDTPLLKIGEPNTRKRATL